MISDALTPSTSYVTLPTDQINYMRNSIKATVDAYDGTVTLYEWDDDPILDAWKKVFPGLVKDRGSISPDLLQHLRYPEDMFKVQRSILAQYHVSRPQDFYKGTDLWNVPQDPAEQSSKQPPYRLSVQLPAKGERSLTGEDGEDTSGTGSDSAGEVAPPKPVFSLTSVYVPNGRDNLASFIAVNSDATSPDYGDIRILRLPDDTTVQGPAQIANTFGSDDRIQAKLLPIKNNSQILSGNLLTLPVGGGLLYVQPVYALNPSGQGTFPVLRFVLASFGKEAGSGETLTEALQDVLRNVGSDTNLPPDDPGNPDAGGGGGDLSPEVLSLLRQADQAYDDADAALRRGDTVGWARNSQRAEDFVRRAIQAAEVTDRAAPDTSPSASPSGSPSGSASPSDESSG